ncbi:Mo-dependent nitrogenase family protein [Microseira wollei NIES-4236]|uniref:Mo-dependent nitrogenase family protein n=3 Tax=Microseira wollei TaxID=467598 RepID=A0AAV3XT52_9CYAN|nr:Mo-dependent nitrogenase family protein [Microseira wollei NIES-4236]
MTFSSAGIPIISQKIVYALAGKTCGGDEDINIKQIYETKILGKVIMLSNAHLYPESPSLADMILHPIRQRLESIQVRDAQFARLVCKLIPSQCPFERDIQIFGKKLFHIPPLCKLNPFYEQFVGLRFQALCFLADVCGEDVSQYCC